MNNIFRFLRQFHPIRWYVALMLLAFGGYAWASFAGWKITGDDNEKKEERSAAGGRNSFYHK